MKQSDTVSARIREAVNQLGRASLDDIRRRVPEATANWMYALTRAGHVIREGRPRAFVYSPGRAANGYGGTPEEMAARRDERRLRANAAERARYAAARGGKVKPRAAPYVPAPRPIARPKPTSRQQIVISPPRAPVFAQPKKPAARRPMTSQEWEAQGGKVQRLPFGAVSKPVLRFIPAPEIDPPATTD